MPAKLPMPWPNRFRISAFSALKQPEWPRKKILFNANSSQSVPVKALLYMSHPVKSHCSKKRQKIVANTGQHTSRADNAGDKS